MNHVRIDMGTRSIELIKPIRNQTLILEYIGERVFGGRVIYLYKHYSGKDHSEIPFVCFSEGMCMNLRVPYGSIPVSKKLINYLDEKE